MALFNLQEIFQQIDLFLKQSNQCQNWIAHKIDKHDVIIIQKLDAPRLSENGLERLSFGKEAKVEVVHEDWSESLEWGRVKDEKVCSEEECCIILDASARETTQLVPSIGSRLGQSSLSSFNKVVNNSHKLLEMNASLTVATKTKEVLLLPDHSDQESIGSNEDLCDGTNVDANDSAIPIEPKMQSLPLDTQQLSSSSDKVYGEMEDEGNQNVEEEDDVVVPGEPHEPKLPLDTQQLGISRSSDKRYWDDDDENYEDVEMDEEEEENDANDNVRLVDPQQSKLPPVAQQQQSSDKLYWDDEEKDHELREEDDEEEEEQEQEKEGDQEPKVAEDVENAASSMEFWNDVNDELVYCEACTMSFVDENKLQEHLKRRHPESSLIKRCQYCQKTFAVDKFLSHHIDEYHEEKTMDVEKPHVCPVSFCQKRF